jgi:hypothetical protein
MKGNFSLSVKVCFQTEKVSSFIINMNILYFSPGSFPLSFDYCPHCDTFITWLFH